MARPVQQVMEAPLSSSCHLFGAQRLRDCPCNVSSALGDLAWREGIEERRNVPAQTIKYESKSGNGLQPVIVSQ